jgi:hypothetical protein
MVGALRTDGDIGDIGERRSSDDGSVGVGSETGAARGEGGKGISHGSVGGGWASLKGNMVTCSGERGVGPGAIRPG